MLIFDKRKVMLEETCFGLAILCYFFSAVSLPIGMFQLLLLVINDTIIANSPGTLWTFCILQ